MPAAPQPATGQASGGQGGRPLGELLNANPELVAHLRRYDMLRMLLRRNLVAAAIQQVEVPQERSDALLEQYWQQQQLSDGEARNRHLRDRLLSPADLRWQVELQPRIRAYSRQHFAAKAEAHFLQRKGQLDQVVYSLLRVKEAYLAREIYLQLQDGEAEFGDLVARYAEGPERSSNGVITSPLGQAHPQLAARLATAQPGELLEPFAIGPWWLVVRLEHSNPACFDEAMAQRMAVELFQQWIDEQLTDRLAAMQRPSTSAPRP